ncbi:hypothetical protein NDU88_007660 [Pleurodeles waltl]|uniref:Uncharacterized protein n=1 Tax=Pleurodeles waltl TaxID=8319 RepID=A0AAV7RQR2_PLEWA|nr:hypothetical protein NDU88_007660 [Pleurodeles waltl]
MAWGSPPPRDPRVLTTEGRGRSELSVLLRLPFWVAAAAKPPVVIMAGFKLRAWIVVRERRTTRAAPLVPGHAPL